MPFVKLDCGIIHSSLWTEDSDTKICWITMLLLADATGFVRAAPSAIAREAGISAEAGRKALELFASPDDESRSSENAGKRIEKIEGGYRVLNYDKYRAKDYTAAERMRRMRERNRVTRNRRNETVTLRKQKQKHTKEEEGPNRSGPTASFSVEEWLKELEKEDCYKGINIRVEYGKCRQWCLIHGKTLSKRRFVNWINRAEKPLPGNAVAKPTYKRNYMEPANEPTEAELQAARDIAKREVEKFRKSLTPNNSGE